MARLPNPGTDNEQWGTLLNEFLQVSLIPDGTPVNILDTMAALKALAPVEAAKRGTTYIKGYHTTGDGGEGVFCWNSASNQQDNGGLSSIPPEQEQEGGSANRPPFLRQLFLAQKQMELPMTAWPCKRPSMRR